MRHAIVGCVEHAIGKDDVVAGFAKGCNQLLQKFGVLTEGEALYVFENAVFGLQFGDDAHVVEH
ncbi:hypothetical protein D3C76_834920 [compost metagenome]